MNPQTMGPYILHQQELFFTRNIPPKCGIHTSIYLNLWISTIYQVLSANIGQTPTFAQLFLNKGWLFLITQGLHIASQYPLY